MKQHIRKNLLPVSLLLLIFLSGNILLASAYFSDGDEKENLLTIGVNTLDVEEDFDPPVPGKKTVKNPRAVNTGNVPCYVRARILLSDSRAEEWLHYYTEDTEGWNLKDWTPEEDGWLYYNEILAVNEETPALFTHLLMEQEIPEDLQDLSIDVIFESVQSGGFSDPLEAFQALQSKKEE